MDVWLILKLFHKPLDLRKETKFKQIYDEKVNFNRKVVLQILWIEFVNHIYLPNKSCQKQKVTLT